MNQSQKKYAVERVDQILRRKQREAEEKHTSPGVSLTPEQRAEAIRKGRIKLRPGVRRVRSYQDVGEVLRFEDEVEGRRDDVAIKKAHRDLAAEAARIKDELMLGDATEALAMIRKFDTN